MLRLHFLSTLMLLMLWNVVSFAHQAKRPATTESSSAISATFGRGTQPQQQVDFLLPPLIAIDGQPEIVLSADFNGDHNADLCVGSYGGSIEVLLGNGRGSFPVRHHYSLGNGGHPFAISIADMNGDHVPDLVAVTYNNVQIFLGNGDGTFQSPQQFASGIGGDTITTGDFNGDGKIDVVIGTTRKALYVFLGNGDGTLQPGVAHSLAISPSSIVSADFNHDGKLDLAAGSGTGVTLVLW